MSNLSKDAKYFIEGVTKELRIGTEGSTMVPRMTEILHKITSSARNGKSARIESVVTLSSKEKSDITRFLSRLLSHEVTLECKINKQLIGGLRMIVGDWVVDTSLATQIDEMQEQLTA